MNTGKQGKDRWILLPIEPVRQVVKVLGFGALKHTDNGWQTVVRNTPDKYYDALMRHLADWRSGQRIDPESGLPTMAHIACNAIILLWAELTQGVKEV